MNRYPRQADWEDFDRRMLEFYRDRVIAKDDDPVRKTAEAFGICEAEVVQIVNAELQALETRDIRDWRGDR